MKITASVHPTSRAKWRAWLKKNHRRFAEIWLIYDKKADGHRPLAYADAVEEELCFGWIDGVVKPIDERQYAQRFTPRRKGSNWSAVNRVRFENMVGVGLMTQAGETVGPHDAAPLPTRWSERDPIPDFIARRLKGGARKNFQSLSRSYREQYVRWIIEAKQEETRTRRLAKAIEMLARNERIFG